MNLKDSLAALGNKDKNGAPIPGNFSDIFLIDSKTSLAESQLGEFTKSFVNGLGSKGEKFLGNIKAPSKDKLAKLRKISDRLKLSKKDKVDKNNFVKKLINNFLGNHSSCKRWHSTSRVERNSVEPGKVR